MRILGIDPGYDRLGIAVIEKPVKGKETVLHASCLQTSSNSIYERLKSIGNEACRVLDEYKPDEVALETLFITKNQKTAMRVAEARGIVVYEAAKRGLPIFEYSPMQIKSAISGDGTIDKQRMIKMLEMLIKIPNNSALDDEYDAIAVALTHSAIRNSLIHNRV